MKKDDLRIKEVTMFFKKEKKQNGIKQILEEFDDITNKLAKAEHREDEKEWFELVDKLAQLTGASRDHTIFNLVTLKHQIIDTLGETLEEMKEKEQAHD